MLGGLLFRLMRIFQITTLVPIVGMLGWFVHIFDSRGQLTPDFILVSFIVAVLALAWTLATLFRMDSVRRAPVTVALIDLGFVGAFIAADYFLRFIGSADCTDVGVSQFSVSLGPYGLYTSGNPLQANVNKTCAMLKASWAFDIMNTMFFFVTFLLAMILHRRDKETHVRETRVRKSRHGSRRGHSSSSRRHSSSRRYYV